MTRHRALALVLLLVGADQAAKFLAAAWLADGEAVPLLGSWVRLTLRHNVAFLYGAGAGWPAIRWLAAATTLGALGLLFWVYRAWLRDRSDPFWLDLFMALTAAGVAGNLLDRLVLGYVRDFLQIKWIGTVNLADIYTTVCLVALAVALRRKRVGQSRGSAQML